MYPRSFLAEWKKNPAYKDAFFCAQGGVMHTNYKVKFSSTNSVVTLLEAKNCKSDTCVKM